MIARPGTAPWTPRPRAAAADGRPFTTAALLNWAFELCSVARLAGYVPTMWAIHASASSGQHSLLTWLSWMAANATMAAWLYEGNGRRANLAVAATCANAGMCLLTMALIVVYR